MFPSMKIEPRVKLIAVFLESLNFSSKTLMITWYIGKLVVNAAMSKSIKNKMQMIVPKWI